MKMDRILAAINACAICKRTLAHEPRPVVAASCTSKIIIIGQAPGRKVHASGIPWNDPSGDLLRDWMGVDKEAFYDSSQIALIPMGFCYPGTGASGDLPPRPECAPRWHAALFEAIPNCQLRVLIGQYAQRYYLDQHRGENLTARVRRFADYLPQQFVLPHPSPRNRLWLRRNPWFEEDVLPVFRALVAEILQN